MSSTIAVEELRIGIYVQLEGGWLSQPFPLSSFRISSEDQLQTLRALGLRKLRWLLEKSDPPEPIDDRHTLGVGINPSSPLKPRVLVHDPRLACYFAALATQLQSEEVLA